MAIRIMSLRGVPDDELDEICALFEQNTISFHLTEPGNWYISAGAIWLDDKNQLEQVYTILNQYQQQREQAARDDFIDNRNRGYSAGLIERITNEPVRYIGYLIATGLILYLSVMPFLDFGK